MKSTRRDAMIMPDRQQCQHASRKGAMDRQMRTHNAVPVPPPHYRLETPASTSQRASERWSAMPEPISVITCVAQDPEFFDVAAPMQSSSPPLLPMRELLADRSPPTDERIAVEMAKPTLPVVPSPTHRAAHWLPLAVAPHPASSPLVTLFDAFLNLA